MHEVDFENIEQQNKTLRETSKMLFGDSAELRIVAPKSLQLLKENARYFKKEQFKQLVANVRQDKRLSSVPLCHVPQDGKLEVLSGNHRVQAAVEADIEWILVIVILGDIAKNEKIAIQLSHNALVGVDDPHILADLWAQIDDIKAKCYAGLSSDTLGELQDIKLVTFSTPTIRTKHLVFAFTEAEVSVIKQILDELGKIPADDVYLAPMEQFEAFFDMLQEVKKKENIKNGSLAMLRLVELAGIGLQVETEEAV